MEIKIEQKKIILDDRIIDELENFHKNANSIYNEKHESLKSAFNIISLKNEHDVIKANELFAKLNVKVLADTQKFLEDCKTNPVKDNFMIKDSDGWRIQSHYIGYGMSVEDLENCVNYIVKNNGIYIVKNNKNPKDYTKERILSRIQELEEGKKTYDYDINMRSIMKPQYTEEGHNIWKNADLIITELKRFL